MNRRTAIIAGASGLAAAVALTPIAQAAESANPELEKIHTLLKAHDDAMTAHDLDGVMKTLTDKASVMGTGPGEVWSNPEAIKDAYKHFFEVYDKGQQDFEYQVKVGNLGTDAGWLMASGNVKGKKDGKEVAFPLNVSLTVMKSGGAWKIASMHFSTLTGRPASNVNRSTIFIYE